MQLGRKRKLEYNATRHRPETRAYKKAKLPGHTHAFQWPDPDWKCPLTGKPFVDPVFLTGDCKTYEKSALVKWFDEHSSDRLRSPSGGYKIYSNGFFENRAAKFNLTTCAITGEPLKDPVILEETGDTYERKALERLLSLVYNSSKRCFYLGTTTIERATIYPNLLYPCSQALFPSSPPSHYVFKPPATDARNDMFTPRASRATIHSPGQVDSFALGDVKAVANLRSDIQPKEARQETLKRFKIYKNFTFRSDGFKKQLFIQCRFDKVIFYDCSLMSHFVNCEFRECLFYRVQFWVDFACPGSIFSGCKFVSPHVMEVSKNSGAFKMPVAKSLDFIEDNGGYLELKDKDALANLECTCFYCLTH